jgi:cell division protein ZapA
MKQIEVTIMGQSYLLGCPEDGEGSLRLAVDKVDSAMCAIRDNGKIRARDRIAVLAALNLAVDLVERQRCAADPLAVTPATGGTAQTMPLGTGSAWATPAPAERSWMAGTAGAAQAHSSAAEPHLELLLTKLDQALADPEERKPV